MDGMGKKIDYPINYADSHELMSNPHHYTFTIEIKAKLSILNVY
jgi:hypothetical protein